MKITIIGAGISGLTLAYYLQKKNIPYELLEASSQVGGVIRSIKKGNYLIELGPNSLLADRIIQDFVEEIGLSNEILPANEVSKKRFIFKKGKYRPLPSKPQQLLFSSFFSFKTKWAAFQELSQKPQNIPNETLGSFFRRRFSKEIVDYALSPFVSGIYAGNPDELLVEKTFPFLKEYEQQYGSIIRGFMQHKITERKQSFSFKEGMEFLPKAIYKHLQHTRLNCVADKITKNQNQLTIHTNQGEIETDRIVLALPASIAGHLLRGLYPEKVASLQKIYYPPLVVVHSAYPRDEVKAQLNGFGGLNPYIEGLFSNGSIWTSSVFAGRCPKDEILLTTFVGGSQHFSYTEDLKNIGETVHQELKTIYHISSTKPSFQSIYKWQESIPQYDQQILEAHKTVEELEKEKIWVCSNWKDGVSIADCIKKAQNLAEQFANISKII